MLTTDLSGWNDEQFVAASYFHDGGTKQAKSLCAVAIATVAMTTVNTPGVAELPDLRTFAEINCRKQA